MLYNKNLVVNSLSIGTKLNLKFREKSETRNPDLRFNYKINNSLFYKNYLFFKLSNAMMHNGYRNRSYKFFYSSLFLVKKYIWRSPFIIWLLPYSKFSYNKFFILKLGKYKFKPLHGYRLCQRSIKAYLNKSTYYIPRGYFYFNKLGGDKKKLFGCAFNILYFKFSNNISLIFFFNFFFSLLYFYFDNKAFGLKRFIYILFIIIVNSLILSTMLCLYFFKIKPKIKSYWLPTFKLVSILNLFFYKFNYIKDYGRLSYSLYTLNIFYLNFYKLVTNFNFFSLFKYNFDRNCLLKPKYMSFIYFNFNRNITNGYKKNRVTLYYNNYISLTAYKDILNSCIFTRVLYINYNYSSVIFYYCLNYSITLLIILYTYMFNFLFVISNRADIIVCVSNFWVNFFFISIKLSILTLISYNLKFELYFNISKFFLINTYKSYLLFLLYLILCFNFEYYNTKSISDYYIKRALNPFKSNLYGCNFLSVLYLKYKSKFTYKSINYFIYRPLRHWNEKNRYKRYNNHGFLGLDLINLAKSQWKDMVNSKKDIQYFNNNYQSSSFIYLIKYYHEVNFITILHDILELLIPEYNYTLQKRPWSDFFSIFNWDLYSDNSIKLNKGVSLLIKNLLLILDSKEGIVSSIYNNFIGLLNRNHRVYMESSYIDKRISQISSKSSHFRW